MRIQIKQLPPDRMVLGVIRARRGDSSRLRRLLGRFPGLAHAFRMARHANGVSWSARKAS